MKLALNIKTKKAGQCRGMRQWASHCLEEFLRANPKASRIEPGAATAAVRIGGTDNYLTFTTDSTNTIFQIELASVPANRPVAEAATAKAPPVPMIAFLLALLRVMPIAPTPSGDYDTVVFSSVIGDKTFGDDEYRSALTRLRQYVPEAWYLPFAARLTSPADFFARQQR